MDTITECEQYSKQMSVRESNSPWRLYFRKEYFTSWEDSFSDPVAVDLIYSQMMRGISVAEYKLDVSIPYIYIYIYIYVYIYNIYLFHTHTYIYICMRERWNKSDGI